MPDKTGIGLPLLLITNNCGGPKSCDVPRIFRDIETHPDVTLCPEMIDLIGF